jgi:GNAT superfamily N-acetyltransferase
MQIETVTDANFAEVLPLVAAYQEFYLAAPDTERNRRHFSRFLADHSQGILFLARADDGAAVGMATLYFTNSSVRACVQCLMNDLYVVASARGQGIGRALIEHCRQHAQQLGYDALIWTTASSNATAQRLYDSLGATSSQWLHYRLPSTAT